MESSPQHVEQDMNPGGLPFRPLAWSLVLHALLLGMLVPEFASEGRQVPPSLVLQGRLLSMPAAVRPELQSEPRSEPRPVLPSRPRTIAVAAASQAAVVPAPTFQAPPVVDAQPGGMVTPHEVTVQANVAVTSLPSEAGPDSAGLRQYRLTLAGEARKFRRYPDAARRAGLSGTAEVRVAVTAGERLAELSRSSGHALLDAVALDMLRQAAARAQLPESLRGRQFAVLMPVVFEVEE